MSFKRSIAMMSPQPPRSFALKLNPKDRCVMRANLNLMDATRAKEVYLNMFLEETRVMRANLSLMNHLARAWFEKKKQAILLKQD
jgi:hypothetical protein